MKRREIWIATSLIVLVLTLSTSSASVHTYKWPKERYPARVIITGSITLTNEHDYSIPIQTNFTAMVPIPLEHGNYTATFKGEANVSNETIKFRGELTVEEFQFPVSFVLPNTEIPIEEGKEKDFDAEGSLEITITRVSAVPKVKAWISIRGCVDSYGDQKSFGWLKADARLGEWARVGAFFAPEASNWKEDIKDLLYKGNANVTLNGKLTLVFFSGSYNITINTEFTARVPEEIETYEGSATFEGLAYVSNNSILFRGKLEIEDEEFPIEFNISNMYPELPKGTCLVGGQLNITITPISTGPFSFTLYIARLVKASTIAINFSDSNFYISGFWDVYNITWTYIGERRFNMTAKPVVINGTGEFKVINYWHRFTLDIEGIELVSGRVVFLCFRLLRIPPGDINKDYIVDIFDLVHAAKRYETTPGVADFDFDLDFDDNLKVDIYDLTTIGANLGEGY
ncbi:hypothetical protein DRO69_12800 [Candidatus Bathyarchaeota archaeon]|nr:MAG: hypothetical protein DRO69_12800 [Candidatus Bathyarchaeota archaeon]